MKKKIKDLTYDELEKVCNNHPQDISTGECVGCPFWKFRSVDKHCTCNWIFNLWDDLKEFLKMLEQEIEVDSNEEKN